MNRIRLFIWILSLLLAIPPIGPVRAAQDGAKPAGPSQIVTAFHETLLEVMKNAKTLGTRGRYDKLASQIERTFDLENMARITTGSFWRKSSKPEIEELVAAFTRFSISTYTSQFDGYSGQSFVTQGEKPGPQKTTLVKTQIIDPTSGPVDITYVTRKKKDQWRVIDVLLAGNISELARRISEFRRILKTGGISGLIDVLNAKADQLLAE